MDPESVKSILEDVMRQSGMDKKIEESRTLILWEDIASNLSARTKAAGISRGRMVVNVSDSVILHQLTFLKRKYIDKINHTLGKRVVKDIVFRIGEVEREDGKTGRREDGKTEIESFDNIEIDQEIIARIDVVVAEVVDEEIRNALRDLFVSQCKLDKLRALEMQDNCAGVQDGERY